MKSVNIFITPILLLSILHSAFGIHCFQCSSYDNPECATLLSNDTASPFYVNCTEPNHKFCRKTIITIVDSDKYVRITRSCGFIQHKEAVDNCYQEDDAFKFEKSCQCFTDGCNSSSTIKTTWIVMLTAVLAVVWCGIH